MRNFVGVFTNVIRKLLPKKGFTLVECVVSIAIFAIMSGIVMSIISMCIQQRRMNEKIVADMSHQVDEIASGKMKTDAATDKGIVTAVNGVEKEIEFKKSDGTSAGKIKGKYTVRYDKSSDNSEKDDIKYRVYAIEFDPI